MHGYIWCHVSVVMSLLGAWAMMIFKHVWQEHLFHTSIVLVNTPKEIMMMPARPNVFTRLHVQQNCVAKGALGPTRILCFTWLLGDMWQGQELVIDFRQRWPQPVHSHVLLASTNTSNGVCITSYDIWWLELPAHTWHRLHRWKSYAMASKESSCCFINADLHQD